jgi:hypothetical protein
MICKECRKKPVIVVKRQLCRTCYQRLRAKEKRENRPFGNQEVDFNLSQPKEMLFVSNFFNHNNWSHTPVFFHLGGANYSPDFYDGERNVFIEVVGTHQAFHQNKHKYIAMKRLFPKIAFEVRDAHGALITIPDNGERITWPNGNPNDLSSPITSESEAVGG